MKSAVHWRTTLILGFALLFPAAGIFADELDRARLEQFRAEMKTADKKEKVRWFDDLATARVQGAGPEIFKYAKSPDATVRRGALAALGKIRDAKVFPRLIGLVKVFEKDPATLAEVIRAIGSYGDVRALKTLKSVGRKWLPRNPAVARAAAGALGNIPHRTSVELLIEMLGQTSPRLPSGSQKEISSETHAILRESRSAIIQALQNLTGWDFEDAEAWQRFWKLAGRTWKPGDRALDESKATVWTDPGYGFRIEMPGKGWHFERVLAQRRTRIRMVRRAEGIVAVTLDVGASRNRNGLSPEVLAEQSVDRYREQMKDLREDSVEIESFRRRRVRGVVLRFIGRDGYGSAIRVEERFVLHDGMIFSVGSRCRTGLPEEISEEVARALDSFTLLD